MRRGLVVGNREDEMERELGTEGRLVKSRERVLSWERSRRWLIRDG